MLQIAVGRTDIIYRSTFWRHAVSASVNIVCPQCDAVNRVPSDRMVESGKAVCGKCKAKLFAGHPIALDEVERFDRHIEKSGVPVLVDFWAPWCGPCRMMAPELEAAAERLEPRVRFAKVNTEEAQGLGARYGVQAIPTMILFKDGRELARQSGALQAAGIARFAEAHLSR
jgi:thioredoxin 2